MNSLPDTYILNNHPSPPANSPSLTVPSTSTNISIDTMLSAEAIFGLLGVFTNLPSAFLASQQLFPNFRRNRHAHLNGKWIVDAVDIKTV